MIKLIELLVVINMFTLRAYKKGECLFLIFFFLTAFLFFYTMSFTDNRKELSINNKRKSVTFSPANSVVSYASTSTTTSSSIGSTLSRSSSSNNWLPPISALLSHIEEHNEPAIVPYDYDPTFQYHHTIVEPHIVLPKQKKRKTQPSKKFQPSQPQRQEQRRRVFMPMIPYYFHHEKFGIEACMLQLEGQKKFKNYFYI